MDDLQEFLDEVLPEGWETDADEYGLDFNLVCPHGTVIEQDCRGSSCGCVSPLVQAGLI